MALVYNGWNLYLCMVEPRKHLEAITARPLLMSAVARVTEHAHQRIIRITPQRARQWLDQLGLEVLLNRKGTTWRKLDPATQAAFGGPKTVDLLVQHPSAIRRPVIERDGALRVGFARGEEEALLRWLRG